MLHHFIFFITFGVGLVFCAPQFLTFKDGNIGVNFGGYSAQAGLGGILTGNTAHGGLSASAGTPWGSNAGAGIGGSVNGDTAGVAYAGTNANENVGASSVIGGLTNGQKFGFAGAESHSQGQASISTHTNPVLFSKDQFNLGNVQKIKPPKKYTPEMNMQWDNNFNYQKKVVKSVDNGISPPSQTNDPLPVNTSETTGNHEIRKKFKFNNDFLMMALNIPIGIITSIRDNLKPLSIEKEVTVSKSKSS